MTTLLTSGIVIAFIIGIICKFADADKIIKKVLPISTLAAKTTNVFLLGKLGKANAEKLENGLFKTLQTVGLAVWNNYFEILFSDNKK